MDISFFSGNIRNNQVRCAAEGSFLQKNFHSVQFMETALAHLAYLAGVQELELAGALVVIVLDADTSPPVLDLDAASPKGDVNRVWAVENQAGGGDVNGSHEEMKDEILKMKNY